MPKRRYERHEPTHEWQQIQLLLKDTAQINYEVIRPVILWGPCPKNEARKLVYRHALFIIASTSLIKLVWLRCCPRTFTASSQTGQTDASSRHPARDRRSARSISSLS